MAEIKKSGLYYEGYGSLIVRATSGEYLDGNNECVFDADILDNEDSFIILNNTTFLARAFTCIDEPKEQVYKRALKLWGGRSQLEMLQEESTELALAVRKLIRVDDCKNKENVHQEIADVEIMIEQYKMMFPKSVDTIKAIKKYKVKRLSKRLDKLSFE